MRKPITKKIRFNVFKRDGFKCQYCGQTPPTVTLEIDHIDPVSRGGSDSIHNLLTACFDCNRGKGAGLLSSIPESVSDRSAIMKERLDQVRAFDRLIKSIRRHEDKKIDEVEFEFNEHWDGCSFTPQFRSSVRVFVQKLPICDVIEYMQISCSKILDRDRTIKYFCGICWNRIRSGTHGSR
jgi:hypothetical protein